MNLYRFYMILNVAFYLILNVGLYDYKCRDSIRLRMLQFYDYECRNDVTTNVAVI